MNVRRSSICLLTLCVILACCDLAVGRSVRSTISRSEKPLNVIQAVNLLGDQQYISKNDNYVKLFLFLNAHPKEAMQVILSRLTPVSATVLKPLSNHRTVYYRNREAIRAVNYIRVLRFITGGLSFVASTDVSPEAIGGQRRQSLQELPQLMKNWNEIFQEHPQSKENLVGFFGIWSSRAVVYLAPVDAQRVIIKKWKYWYRRCGQLYPYRTRSYTDPDLMVFHFDRKQCERATMHTYCCGDSILHNFKESDAE